VRLVTSGHPVSLVFLGTDRLDDVLAGRVRQRLDLEVVVDR
jgi:hypothetical protein